MPRCQPESRLIGGGGRLPNRLSEHAGNVRGSRLVERRELLCAGKDLWIDSLVRVPGHKSISTGSLWGGREREGIRGREERKVGCGPRRA